MMAGNAQLSPEDPARMASSKGERGVYSSIESCRQCDERAICDHV